MAPLNRRALIMRGLQLGGGIAVLGSASSLLAACGSDEETESTTAGTTAGTTGDATAGTTAGTTGAAAEDLGELTYRLSWIKNVEFAGSYVADKRGYYTDQGFSSVNLIAGGPSAQPAEVDVSSGTAMFGMSAPDLVASAIIAGSDLVIIGAQYQKNPFCVMSLASAPVKSPEEMYGKSFGLQAANQTVWDAFVAASGIDDAQIEKFPAQFDPTPLANGEVDTWFSFVTNEPNLLKMEGIETYSFLLADFGYPLVSEVYLTKREYLTSKRAEIKAFLLAEIKGWHDVRAEPKMAAELTTGEYGADLGLDPAEQVLEVMSELELMFTADTLANGFATMTDELVAENVATLVKAGIDITTEQLFDLSILKEIYAENPDLLTPPAAGTP